jgi:hypothetical protein
MLRFYYSFAKDLAGIFDFAHRTRGKLSSLPVHESVMPEGRYVASMDTFYRAYRADFPQYRPKYLLYQKLIRAIRLYCRTPEIQQSDGFSGGTASFSQQRAFDP